VTTNSVASSDRMLFL